MFLFLRLLLAHMIGDFPLQTERIYKLKSRGIIGIIPHVLVVTGCMALLCWPYLHLPAMWFFLGFLGITHLIQDQIKIMLNKRAKHVFPLYFLDQAVHVGLIMCVFLTDLGSLGPPPTAGILTEIYNNNALILLLIILLTASFNGHFMIIQLKKDLWGITSQYSAFEKWYGMLERCILCCASFFNAAILTGIIPAIILSRIALYRLKGPSISLGDQFTDRKEILLSCLIGLACGTIFGILEKL